MKNQLPTKRIAKTIAESGICSRRQAEKLIALGKVFVNDIKIITPAFFVNANDKIMVEGKLIKKTAKTYLFILNKPKGVIVSSNDPQGRKTIYDIIPNNMKQLYYIGRLDFNTEGLLLLTNNGSLKRFLELPVNKIERTYKVKIYGNINNLDNQRLEKGITIDNIKYGPIIINVLDNKGKNTWITVKLKEGKNREIRKVMSHFHLHINDLIRTNFGPFKLNNLKRGGFVEVEESIINLFIKDKNLS
ncbi:rRNA pseudouridine synthase [Alphaproteobacteria bacterium]|nr:rRNA pseudouridine synthase [Alphaproteobacteria bacterium]